MVSDRLIAWPNEQVGIAETGSTRDNVENVRGREDGRVDTARQYDSRFGPVAA
jgi:hypothetical protein